MSRAAAGQGAFALHPSSLVDDLDTVFEQFNALWNRAPPIVAISCAGRHFECRGSAPEYAKLVPAALHPAPAREMPGVRVLILSNAAELALRWSNRTYHERETEALLRDKRYLLAHDPGRGFWQLFDRATARGVQLMRGPEGYPPWEPGSPLRNFIHWSLATAQRGLVHAGTLGLGASGVLLAGAGGHGKSGTVIAGITGGLKTVGDDYVLVDLTEGGVRLVPVFRSLKQDRQGVQRLGLGLLDRTINWQGKVQLAVEELAIDAVASALEAHALLCPSIAHMPETRLHPLDPKSAFTALAPSGVGQIPGDRAHSFALAGAIVRRLPCYRLELGTDPAEIARTLRRFLERPMP